MLYWTMMTAEGRKVKVIVIRRHPSLVVVLRTKVRYRARKRCQTNGLYWVAMLGEYSVN